MTQADVFIEKYKELERIVRESFGLDTEHSIVHCLTSNKKFYKYTNDIKYCSEIRNWLQHNKKISNEFSIIPNEAVIDFIDHLISKVKNRPKCFDVSIKFPDVFAEGMDGIVKNAMNVMIENSYTHIPLLENDKVIGVFDENSVFNYLAEQEIADISERLSFRDIEKYVQIDGREMEEFEFVKPNVYLDDLEILFEDRFKNGKRIGMVFITVDGKRSSKLLGIITAWDIVAARKKY